MGQVGMRKKLEERLDFFFFQRDISCQVSLLMSEVRAAQEQEHFKKCGFLALSVILQLECV